MDAHIRLIVVTWTGGSVLTFKADAFIQSAEGNSDINPVSHTSTRLTEATGWSEDGD